MQERWGTHSFRGVAAVARTCGLVAVADATAHARWAPYQAACPSWAQPGSQGHLVLTRLGAYPEAFAGLDLGQDHPSGGYVACLAAAYLGYVDSSWSSSWLLCSAGQASQLEKTRRSRCAVRVAKSTGEWVETVVGMSRRRQRDYLENTIEMRAIERDACVVGASRSRREDEKESRR
jgi:hypothetical protein